jgi:hypothetical protein
MAEPSPGGSTIVALDLPSAMIVSSPDAVADADPEPVAGMSLATATQDNPIKIMPVAMHPMHEFIALKLLYAVG